MTDGTCFLCGQTYTKRGMTRHLRSCLPDDESGADPLAILRIAGEHRSDYWIHVAVDQRTELAALDAFLRDLWLECCGHLSAFDVGGLRCERPYSEDEMPTGFGVSRQSMDVTLESALASASDDEFGYEYDFGSTTALEVRAVETGRWDLVDLARETGNDVAAGHEGIALLTRNEPPERECGDCGAPAVEICQTCLWERGPDARLCADCADDHGEECDRPAFLPVVNSPRSGVCGYTG